MSEEKFDLSGMLEQAMKDPAVAELARNLKQNAESNPPPVGGASGIPSENVSVAPSIPPELMSKLPEIMSSLGPLIGGDGGTRVGTSDDVERRNRLLSAMRPYLSDGRKDMIDKFLSLSKMTTILDILPKKDSSV